MLKIAVLVSGGGTNLKAIIDSIDSGLLNDVEIAVVISSSEKAYAINRAIDANIHFEIIKRGKYEDIDTYDLALIESLEKHNVELIVMAGFLNILGQVFNNRYKNKIINVHPSLIPSFCGNGYYGIIPHQKAIEYGVKITGATVHFVEQKTDAGPIILQKAVSINEDDTPETLQKRVMEEAEWIILPEVIKLIASGKVVVEGRKVRILS